MTSPTGKFAREIDMRFDAIALDNRPRVGIGIANTGGNSLRTMKTPLKALSLLFALGFPTALFAQFAGARVPAAVAPGYLFLAFVAALVLLITISDYARNPRPPVRRIAAAPQPASVPPPAASSIEHRLAA